MRWAQKPLVLAQTTNGDYEEHAEPAKAQKGARRTFATSTLALPQAQELKLITSTSTYEEGHPKNEAGGDSPPEGEGGEPPPNQTLRMEEDKRRQMEPHQSRATMDIRC